MLNSMTPWRVSRAKSPRPYQKDFFDSVEKAFVEDGHRKVIAVLPTGGGKTYCAGEEIARRVEKGKRVCILAHTRKLVKQFGEALTKDYGIWHTIEAGSDKSDDTSPVVCATIQSMQNRVKKKRWKEDEFDLIVVDESHRILSDGYAKTLTYFQCQVLGLTATPRRGDQRDLMAFFDAKAIDIPLTRLIKEGFLAPLKIKNFPISIELSGASNKGDYSEEEIAHAIEPYLESCAKEYAIMAQGMCGLAFLPLIDTSIKFTSMLNRHGINAEHVDGTMPEDEINRRIDRLLTGRTDVLCNSMLLTEGVDIRPVNAILNLRPTRSWSLYTQICGRGTRLFGERERQEVLDRLGECKWGYKTHCTLFDPLWLCEQHSLLQRPSCLVAATEEEAAEIDEELSKAGGRGGDPQDLMEALEGAKESRHEALRKKLEALAKRKARLVDAMELFMQMGNDDLAEYEPIARWEMDKPTPGQLGVLRKAGIDLDSVKGKGHAKLIIEEIFSRRGKNLATIPMAKLAVNRGMTDAFRRPFEQVKRFLDTGSDPYQDLPD